MAQSDERFAFGLGTVVGIQMLGKSGVTNVTLTQMVVRTANFRAHRQVELLFTVDGNNYKLIGEFEDDTYHRQTLTGAPIHREAQMA